MGAFKSFFTVWACVGDGKVVFATNSAYLFFFFAEIDVMSIFLVFVALCRG